MPPELFDTHCHIDFDIFDHDREEILQRCGVAGITKIIVPAVKHQSWPKLITLRSQHVELYKAYGLHPVFLPEHQDIHLTALDELLEAKRPAAVGEIGLDFYIKELDQPRQLKLFIAQLKLANKHQLPVILHVRKAHQQVLQQLEDHRVAGGLVHAFNGSIDQALRYTKLGFKLGFGGAVTWPNARKIRALAEQLPLDSIVLETDAPDMTVESLRSGKHGFKEPARNSPEYLPEILNVLAAIRKISPDELALRCTQNALSILKE